MKRYFPNLGGNQLITPEIAGWEFSGLAIFQIPKGEFELPIGLFSSNEAALIPLNGEKIEITVDEEVLLVQGRSGVFAGATDWIYVSPSSAVKVRCKDKFELAVATARANKKFKTVYVPKSEVVEIRGAGSATREIRPLMHPDYFPNAVKLNVVEVITPDGNTSSYPPHRHDGIASCPFNNEEIYYFRIGKVNEIHGSSEGFGMHRTYSAPEDSATFDESVSVKDGDIYLVDRGYHGPCSAMPGYPMYYLNVLAGPSEIRTMGFCDDPEYKHIREDWKKQEQDTRVPWRIKQ